MGFREEEACNDCPDCHGCSRKYKKFKVWYCDKCEKSTDELYYGFKNEELCWDCFKEQFLTKICDDLDETKCSNCGNEAEEMFRFGSEWVCAHCLKDMAERVDTE